MCELFGFSSEKGFVINEYLKEFYSHSLKHSHGWGLACLEGNEAFIEKEPMQASKSKYLKSRLTVPIDYKNVFAHIRYATVGNIDYLNCHPYTKKDTTGRRWTMIHNGTIFEYYQMDKYVKLQAGDTDSERILLYIVDKVDEAIEIEGRPLVPEERFELIDGLVTDISKGNKLNLMLYDGEYMYIHTNYKDSMYYLEKYDGIIFSTQPLRLETPVNEHWEKVPFTRLLVYKDGKNVYMGNNHGHEFIDNEENMKMLYQAFSNL
jgi:glutamine amidotransferase